MSTFEQRCVLAACALVAATTLAARPTQSQQRDTLWTIRAGAHAGAEVAIDSGAASTRGSKFWRVSNVRGAPRLIGWNPSRLPIAVAFRDGGSIRPSDSAAFWSILERMHEDLGMILFRPVSLEKNADPEDVIVVDIEPMLAHDGITFVTWSSHGELYDARVFFGSPSKLGDERVVTHEMMHALGFGHTSRWRSVMNPGGSPVQRLTREDVAYAQRAFEARETGERSDLWHRFALAVSRGVVASPRFSCGSAFLPQMAQMSTDVTEERVLSVFEIQNNRTAGFICDVCGHLCHLW